MSKKQWLVLILLGVADAVVLCVMGFVVVRGLPARPEASTAGHILPAPTASPSPRIPPTWTPSPTAAPEDAAAAVAPTSTPRPPTSDETATLNEVEQNVAALRGLDVLSPVPRWVLTDLQWGRRVRDRPLDDGLEEQTRSLALALAALDLLDPHEDLPDLLEDVLSTEVGGFYDVQADEIYLINNGEIAELEDQLLFAHEFTHALQDQHFDLASLGLDATDRSVFHADYEAAVRALIEGDAALVQQQYLETYFTPEDIISLQHRYGGTGRSALDEAPLVVREALLFPYTHGREFVATLVQDGGWGRVNGAYLFLPSSTEQILHPDRYLAGDQPLRVALPSPTDTLGSEWQLAYDGQLGEFLLRIHLQAHLEASQAEAAAEGWGGDACAVYHGEAADEQVLLLRVLWDTPEDADEFLGAYFSWADARFQHTYDTLIDEVACWDGADVLCLTWEGQAVTIGLGPDRELVTQMLDAVPR
jgi:hypothetical protein